VKPSTSFATSQSSISSSSPISTRIYLAWAVSFLFPNNPLFSICCEACLHKYYLSRSLQNNKFISSNNNGSSSIQCSKTNPEQQFQATAILAVKNGRKKSLTHTKQAVCHTMALPFK
jgi:hypothetical protein